MKVFLRILILLVIFVSVFSFYITRDGELYIPEGKGEVKLSSGSFEGFPLPDYAFEMIDKSYKSYFIEVEPGLKVHVLETGKGFPIFLMHGNPTSGFLYRKVVENLPLDRVRVIMPTSLGLGFSSKIPASMHTADNHIRWINKVLEELELSELIYAGQDWGGPIGMGALALSPNLLKGAVLLNTGFNAPTEEMDLSPAHATVKTPIIGEMIIEVFFSIFRASDGSSLFLSFSLASSAFSLASARETSGCTPKESNFSLPLKRYFIRQYLEPLGLTSRNNPRPSAILKGLSEGFALLT